MLMSELMIERFRSLFAQMNLNMRDWDYTMQDKATAVLRESLHTPYAFHSGATKLCLDIAECPFVIKWCHDRRDWMEDECVNELNIYNNAVKANLENFFPETQFMFIMDGITFIAQAKVDCCCAKLPRSKCKKYDWKARTVSGETERKARQDIRKSRNGSLARHIDDTWLRLAIVLYGKKVIKSLCEFIVANGINDLHGSNLGYTNDRPVILDFGGYGR